MRVFRNAVFFILLFAGLVGMSGWIQKTMMNNSDYVPTRNKNVYQILKEPENSIDVVIAGDSLSYTSIIPMKMWEDKGITSYAAGQPGQTIQEAYHMLKSMFRNQSPKLVLLETNTLFRDETGISGLKEILEEIGNYYIPLLRGHDIWKSVLAGKKYKLEMYKGFSFRCEIAPYKKGKYMIKSTDFEKIPDSSVIYMKKIRKLCDKNNAKLVLVSTPSPANYSYPRHNGLKSYAENYSMDYLDMNLDLNKIGINWETDSLDNGDHLNLLGAWKTTKHLEKYLSRHYKLVDHRNDRKYRLWDILDKKYKKAADVNMKKMLEKITRNQIC